MKCANLKVAIDSRDSKLSWIALMASVLLVFSSLGFMRLFGIFYSAFLKEFKSSKEKTGMKLLTTLMQRPAQEQSLIRSFQKIFRAFTGTRTRCNSNEFLQIKNKQGHRSTGARGDGCRLASHDLAISSSLLCFYPFS